jgi:hypothetical protein
MSGKKVVKGIVAPSPLKKKVEKIKLYDAQRAHVEKAKTILEQFIACFDMSVMGAGKTYTTSVIGMEFEYEHMVVFCPSAVEKKWRKMATDYNVPLTVVTSYESLRSKKGSQPTHGLLKRDDSDKKPVFTVTKKFKRMVEEGVLLVCDESQKIKNKSSAMYDAVRALTTHVILSGGASRIMLLSGTPFDKEEQVISMMRLLGFIRSDILKIYNKETNELRLIGAQELIDFCMDIDEGLTSEMVDSYRFTDKNVPEFCYKLFQDVIKPNIAIEMPLPEMRETIDCMDGYYNLPQEDSVALKSAITNLRSAAQFNVKTGKTNYDGKSFGAITKSLIAAEGAKLNTIARLAFFDLEENPNCKVVIGVNYVRSIEELSRVLAFADPLVLHGRIHKDKRFATIQKFQEANSKHRLLITNIRVSASGIDLDDKDGDYPRKVYVVPNYSIQDLQQFTGRFIRADSQSSASIRFVYGRCGVLESSILNALARKNKVMSETLNGQVEAGIRFPGGYDREEEADLKGYPSGIYPTEEAFNVDLDLFRDVIDDEEEEVLEDIESDEEEEKPKKVANGGAGRISPPKAAKASPAKVAKVSPAKAAKAVKGKKVDDEKLERLLVAAFKKNNLGVKKRVEEFEDEEEEEVEEFEEELEEEEEEELEEEDD